MATWFIAVMMGCQSAQLSTAHGNIGRAARFDAQTEARAHWVLLYSEAPIPDERFEVRVGNWQRWPNGSRASWPQFHWLDPHTVIASLWRIDDWEAGQNDLPQNWVFDLATGTRRRLSTDGQIACANSRHIVIVRSATEGAGRAKLDRSWITDFSDTVVGTIEQGFKPFAQSALAKEVDARHPLTAATCLPAPHHEDFSPPDASLSILRLGDEGYIALNDRGSALLPPGVPPPKRHWTVFNSQRKATATWIDPCQAVTWPSIQAEVVSAPHLGAYLSVRSGLLPNSGEVCPRMLIHPQGRIEPFVETPQALRKLTGHIKDLIGLTTRGPLWLVLRAADNAPRGWPGLYIQEQSPSKDQDAGKNAAQPTYPATARATQVLAGDVPYISPVSPDGCRLIAAQAPEGSILRYAERSPGKERQMSTFIAIDFCLKRAKP